MATPTSTITTQRVDLAGFGHSERRTELLSPSTMGGFLVRALDGFELEDPHLVYPDVGAGVFRYRFANAVSEEEAHELYDSSTSQGPASRCSRPPSPTSIPPPR